MDDLDRHRFEAAVGPAVSPETAWQECLAAARAEAAERAARRIEAFRRAQAGQGRRSSLGLASGAAGLIEALRPHLPPIPAILEGHGYRADRRRDRYVAPGSSSGIPGVVLLRGDDGIDRIYSHHGAASDPLAAEGNGGHALDAVDALTILRFGGDLTEALRTLATEHGIDRADRQWAERGDSSAGDDASDDWPDPENLAPEPAGLATGEYPIDALPSVVRDAVVEVAAFTQAPLSMVALSALCAASAAVQSLVDIQRKPKLLGPTGIFGLTIAASGERKSTVDGLMCRGIRAWEAEKRAELRLDVIRANAAIEAHAATRRGITAALASAAKSGDEDETARLAKALEDHDMAEPKPVIPPRILLDDVTAEALVAALAEHPSQFLCSAEAGSFIGGYSMSSERVTYTLATLNKAWDGAALSSRRKVAGSLEAQSPRLAVTLMVQSEVLSRFMAESGGLARGIGALARFLVVEPISTQGQRFDQGADMELPALDRFSANLRGLLDRPLPKNQFGAFEPGVIILGDKARDAWRESYNSIESELRVGGRFETLRDFASKAAEQIARVAGVLTTIEHGAGAYPTETDVRNAARIVAWHMDQALRLMSRLDADAGLSAAAALSQWLVQRCQATGSDRVSRRDIQRLGPSAVRSRESLSKAVAELAEAGHVRAVADGKARLIVVNPKLLGVARR